MVEKMLTPAEVAELLQVSKETVMRHLRQGIIRGVKVGRQWRVRPEVLEEFMRRNGLPCQGQSKD